MNELQRKLSAVRRSLDDGNLRAVRLRGTDWFSWISCGGSNVVLLSTDTGIAEVLITAELAVVLTDEIEAERLKDEELPDGLEVRAFAWATPADKERFIAALVADGAVASDLPQSKERPLPASLRRTRSSLGDEELERYRALGRDAAEAMTEVLLGARPEWTGFELAGAGAEALWSRGIHPALTLAGDARRLPIHRHATASLEPLGSRAMLVFCARRHGLFANLTRFVYFQPPTAEQLKLTHDVAAIEADIFAATRPGATLQDLYAELARSYSRHGYPGGERLHHQGGTCGYLSRDVVARPDTATVVEERNAVAWNPSLTGAKIEDTVVVSTGRPVEVLTVDPKWPVEKVNGLPRPALLVR